MIEANTSKPQEGTWILTAPNGREWAERSPLACLRAEQSERIPATVRLQRILDAADEPTDLEKELLASLQKLLRAYRNAVGLHDPNHDDAYTVNAHNAVAKALSMARTTGEPL